MNLHTDVPTRAEVDRLLASRHPASVSVHLGTDPASNAEAERIGLKNLTAEAERRLREAGTTAADVSAIVDEIAPRVWLTGGRVLAVRREDVPGGGPAAATLRYPA